MEIPEILRPRVWRAVEHSGRVKIPSTSRSNSMNTSLQSCMSSSVRLLISYIDLKFSVLHGYTNKHTRSIWTTRSTESGFPFFPFTLLTHFAGFLIVIFLVVGLDEFPVPLRNGIHFIFHFIFQLPNTLQVASFQQAHINCLSATRRLQ